MPSRGASSPEVITSPSSHNGNTGSPGSPTSPSAAASSSSSFGKEKKRRGLLGLKSPFKFMGGGKIFCQVRQSCIKTWVAKFACFITILA